MKKPATVATLEELGRVGLSKHFFMRDFLYSEISQIEGVPNIPDYPDRAVEAGRQLCEQLLEPLQDRFGRICIRSAYRAPAVKTETDIVVLRMRATMADIFGTTWAPMATLVLQPVSSCRRCCRGTRNIRTGRRWLGGFTTICLTPANSGSPNWRRSIYGGARTRTRCPL